MEMQEYLPPQADMALPAAVEAELPHPEPDGDEMMVENDDGSISFVEPEGPEEKDTGFYDNLAEGGVSEKYLRELGSELIELVEQDQKDREPRDKQYAEGIKRAGMSKDSPGGADFEGASKATHPMLAKACVDFASKAIKELFPANGPCKTQIIGEVNEEKLDRAERKKTFMNWQLTTQVTENRSELEKLLSQLGLGGSQYKRWWWDYRAKRPRTETVYLDDVFLPYNAPNFRAAHRKTYRRFLTEAGFQKEIDDGLFIDIREKTGGHAGLKDKSEAAQAANAVEGVEEDSMAYMKDGLREVYQVFAELDCEEDKKADGRAPYIVHLDKYTGKVLGLYRNWKEDDETFAEKQWIVEYTFIPWRGAQGIGLFHIIGSLSIAATGALRALLDAAHINNFPGGLKLKGGRTAGQSIQVNATELAEIDAPPGVDDIRKLVMAFPFNGPSTVLSSLLEWLTQQAEVVVATASEKIADGANDMPVGTAMALIEGGSTNFSAIHARMHASLKEELAIVHRLNAENLEDEEVIEDLGELTVSSEDFQGPMDIIPVSDPNIFSETQRYAQLQAVFQLRQDPQMASFFKPERLLQRALRLLQVPSPEDIANLPKDPEWTSAEEENYISANDEPRPLKAYFDQDDVEHLQCHLTFMTSPMFGANPLIGVRSVPMLLNHCREHILNLYKKNVQAATDMVMYVAQVQGQPVARGKALSYGAAFADQMMAQLLGPQVMPGLQQAQQLAQKYAPLPQASPDIMHREQAETQRQAAQQMAEDKREQTKLASAERLKQMELAYQSQRDVADRATTERAAQIAAAVAQLQDTTERWKTQFNAMVQDSQKQSEQFQQRLLAEMSAAAAQQQEVLKAFLATMQTQQSTVPNVDFTALLQPVVDSIAAIGEDLKSGIEGVSGKVHDNQSIIQTALNDAVGKIASLNNKDIFDKALGRAGSEGSSQTP